MKERTEYNPETGLFLWKINKGDVLLYKEAGCLLNSGYVQIMINGQRYMAHKLAFLYMTGMWPEVVDHIDGWKRNNRWMNLRACTHQQNQLNRRVNSNSRTRVKNVEVDPRNGKFRVVVNVNGSRKFIGSYDSLEMAELVAIEARNKFHGEYARHI